MQHTEHLLLAAKYGAPATGIDDYAFDMDQDPQYNFGQPAIGNTTEKWPHLAMHPSRSNYLCSRFFFIKA